MKYALILTMLLAQASAAASLTDNRIPDAAVIARMESRIVMPRGANALADYDRTYTRVRINGIDMIVGQMIDNRLIDMIARNAGKAPPPRVRRGLMKDIAPASDGGCTILKLFYEVAATLPPRVVCNSPGPNQGNFPLD